MDFKSVASLYEEKHIYLTTIGRKTKNLHIVELWFAIVGEKIYLNHEGLFQIG